MSFIQNLFTSRDNNAQGNTFVGQQDRIWWNPDTNAFYYSDGNTAGGIPVGTGGANIIANTITVNTITSTGGNVAVTGNLIISGNISPATAGKIGGIQPGPGVFIGNTGILTIDSANLPVSFGNFFANNNILTMVNVDEDMILVTQGNAEIQLVGNVGFYKENGLPPNVANRFARFSNDGQAEFFIPTSDPAQAAFKIIGSSTGNFSAPLNTGVMLQITGQQNDASRFYNDSVGSFSAFVGRRINGTIDSPTAVQAGDEFIRISATGYDGTTIPGTATSRIVFQAMENITPTAKGSNLSFWTVAVGSNVLAKIATVDTANGVNATKFTTAGTVSATGNITGGNVLVGGLASVTGNVTGGNVLTGGVVSATGTITSAANVTGGNILTAGLISATSNITGGNLTTAGIISATGNVTGGNVLTGGLISATSNVTAGNVLSTGRITSNSATAGIGYQTGAGGTVTQLVSKSTAVTLDAITGQITSNAATMSGGATATFTLTNSAIASTDVMIINQVSTTNLGNYLFLPICNAGAANITILNRDNSPHADAIVMRFVVIKGAIN